VVGANFPHPKIEGAMSKPYVDARAVRQNTGRMSTRERIVVVVGTAVVIGLGCMPIYYRRKDRAHASYETMAEKLEAQKSREKAAAARS
jgi:hypothetical protein